VNNQIPQDAERVRTATEADLAEVLEVERLSFADPWSHSFLKAGLNDIFLVYEKEKIAGYLIACVCSDIDKAVILKVAVHPSYRGKGIAKILLRTCLDTLIQEKVRIVELDVELTKREAIHLYEKFGFKISTVMTFPAEDDTFYIMRLELSH